MKCIPAVKKVRQDQETRERNILLQHLGCFTPAAQVMQGWREACETKGRSEESSSNHL